jgi:ketosteroid isomerase-like protein
MSTEEISTNALTVTPDSGEIVRRFMDAALVQQDPTAVDNYFAADVTFVAIVPNSLELTAIVPWYGTRHSPAGVKEAYALLLTNLELLAFEPAVAFGAGENAAMFGRFRFRSKITGKLVDSEWAIRAKVHDGRITYFQFYENSYTVASTFRRGGSWDIENHLGRQQVP